MDEQRGDAMPERKRPDPALDALRRIARLLPALGAAERAWLRAKLDEYDSIPPA